MGMPSGGCSPPLPAEPVSTGVGTGGRTPGRSDGVGDGSGLALSAGGCEGLTLGETVLPEPPVPPDGLWEGAALSDGTGEGSTVPVSWGSTLSTGSTAGLEAGLEGLEA